MDEEITQYVKSRVLSEKSSRKLQNQILSNTDEIILSYIDKRSASNEPVQAVSEYARALFLILESSARENRTSRSANILLNLVIKCIKIFKYKSLSTEKRCTDCVDLFNQNLDALPPQSLPDLAETVIENVDDNGVELELLPRLLRILGTTVSVSAENGASVTGVEYGGAVFQRFIDADWSKGLLRRAVGMAKEMCLEKAQAEALLKKIFVSAETADVQDLPAIVYQLLVYASKSCNRKCVIQGVLRLFEGIGDEKKSAEVVVRQIEGTVLLHINFAIKQDPSLGQELLSVVRGGNGDLKGFSVACLLSLARIPRFEEGALAVIKAGVVKAYQDVKQARDCWWFPCFLREQCLQFAKSAEKAVLQSIQQSSFGRDHIIPSIVKIGFLLIECSDSLRISSLNSILNSDGLIGCEELGVEVLHTAFEVHEMARNEIMEQSKIYITSPKLQQSLLVIRLLSQMILQYPHLILGHTACLKECLDYFIYMHPQSASSLIRVMCPLFQMNHDLQNYTKLVLRKAMFGREESARLAATRAIVDLIISEKNSSNGDVDSFPFSQASSSQQTRLPSTMGLNLFQELKGLLKRCLSQQANVKSTMYKGLVNLVLVNPVSATAVFDLLWPHFLRFCETKEDGSLCLKLADCVKLINSTVRVDEPLDCLLSCIHQLLCLQPQNKSAQRTDYSWTCFEFSLSQEKEVGVPSGELLANAFMNLKKTLRSSSITDYNLENLKDLNPETPEDEKKIEQARILSGILEVLLDKAVSDMKNSTDEGYMEAKNEFEALLEAYESIDMPLVKKQGTWRLKSFIKGQTQDSASIQNQNSKSVSKNPATALFYARTPSLTLSNIAFLLKNLLDLIKNGRSSSQPTSQLPTQRTAQKLTAYQFKLASFTIRALMRHLNAFSPDMLVQDEFENLLKPFGNGDLKVLGRSLLQFVYLLISVANSFPNQEKAKSKDVKGRRQSESSGEGLLHMSLVCIDMLCRLSNAKLCLQDVIEEMLSVPRGEDDATQNMETEENDVPESGSDMQEARMIHFFLLKKTEALLQKLLSLRHFTEFEVLSGTVFFLGSRLPPSLRKIHGVWIDNICQKTKITHNGAARALVTLAAQFSVPSSHLILGQQLACELLKVTGSEEKDPVDSSDKYCIVNLSTRNAIATSLLQLCEATLVDADWLIMRLKAYPSSEIPDHLNATIHSTTQDKSTRFLLEETLHSTMDSLVRLLSFFTEMCLENSLAEHFLKVTLKMYKALALLTKLSIAPKGYKQSSPSSKFQNLAELTCRKLTAPVYNFVAVMQRDQQENSQAKGVVNKIKRECKTIPNLIFHMEDYEKYLIQLSKITKVNLMKHAKRSTARDFKILDVSKKAEQNDENQAPETTISEEATIDIKTGNENVDNDNGIQGSPNAVSIAADSDGDSRIKVSNKRRRKNNATVQDSDEENS